MAVDALDPGADGTFPYWPRLPDGSTDARRMPRGPRLARLADGRQVFLDPAPGEPDGSSAGPPEPPAA